MTVRFNAAEVPEIVPVTATVLAPGEPSTHNLKRCLDGTIGQLGGTTTLSAFAKKARSAPSR